MTTKPTKVPVSGYVTRDGKARPPHVGVRHKNVGLSDHEKANAAKKLIEQVKSQMTSYGATDEQRLRLAASVRDALQELLGESEINSDQNFSEVDEVVFALDPETSKWASVGITPDMPWQVWDNLGFSPEEARGWLDKGYTAAQATQWREFGPDLHEEWIQTVNDCSAGPSVTEHEISSALMWASRGHTPEEYKFCSDNNINIRQAAFGQSLGDVKTFCSLMADWNMSEVDMRKWADTVVPPEDIHGWLEKGYSPTRAETLTKKGKSSKDVPDLMGDEPLPGKAWPKFKESFTSLGWTQSEVVVPRYPEGSKIVMIKKGTAEIALLFKSNGKFVRLYQGWRRRGDPKTIKSALETLKKIS